MSTTDLEDALGAIRRLKLQIDNLNVEIDRNAWKSSPALAQGMSLRDYFAGQALAGNLANKNAIKWETSEVAFDCYRHADEMLAAREAKT